MKTNKRYDLSYLPTMDYFKSNLTDTNVLSSALIELLDFKSGQFFTFLPENVDLEKIHLFSYGGIGDGSRDFVWSMILDKLRADKFLSCVFDDVSTTVRQDYNDPLFMSYGMSYKNEAYYFLNGNTASLETLEQCRYASNSIWHFLCVLFKATIPQNKKKLLLEDIQQICLSAQLIIVGAYDDEGYVLWERN